MRTQWIDPRALLREGQSRIYWPGLLGGLVVALAGQFAAMVLIVLCATAAFGGILAMLSANVAALAAAGTTGLCTRGVQGRDCEFNARIAWTLASAILFLQVGLTTSVMS